MNATVAASAEDADTLDAEDDDDVDRANRTMQNAYGYTGWKCPICSEYVRRKDRYVLEGPARDKRRVLRVDYGSYNMHFGAVHATPFWREQNIIKTVKRYL